MHKSSDSMSPSPASTPLSPLHNYSYKFPTISDLLNSLYDRTEGGMAKTRQIAARWAKFIKYSYVTAACLQISCNGVLEQIMCCVDGVEGLG